jgi:hypothetical protein
MEVKIKLKWKRKIREKKNLYSLTIPKAIGQYWEEKNINKVIIEFDFSKQRLIVSPIDNSEIKICRLKDF